MLTSISGQAGPGTRHLRGHAAGSSREAATVDLSRDSAIGLGMFRFSRVSRRLSGGAVMISIKDSVMSPSKAALSNAGATLQF